MGQPNWQRLVEAGRLPEYAKKFVPTLQSLADLEAMTKENQTLKLENSLLRKQLSKYIKMDFLCEVCGEKFERRKSYNDHIISHPTNYKEELKRINQK